jgi:hypothetical protein
VRLRRELHRLISGGEHPRFERCRFSNSSWEFAGAALRTVGLLRAINGSLGGGAFIASLLAPAAADEGPAVRSF